MDASYLILPQPRKGVANYFLLVKVTRGIASFASLIRSSPRCVAGTPKGVLAIPYRNAYWTGVTMTEAGRVREWVALALFDLVSTASGLKWN